MWATIKLAKLLRQVHDGMRDVCFAGLCASPPKGGFNSITWQGTLSQDAAMKEEVDTIQKDCTQWLNELRGVAQAAQTEQRKEGSEHQPAATLGSSSSKTGPQEVEDKYGAIREEMQILTREIRSAYVCIAPMPYSAAMIRSFVESSALLNKCKMANGTHRICYVYSVNLSWSQKRPASKETDKRAYRPQAIWRDH